MAIKVLRTNSMRLFGSSSSVSGRPNKANKLSSDSLEASLAEEAQKRNVRFPTMNLLCESGRSI